MRPLQRLRLWADGFARLRAGVDGPGLSGDAADLQRVGHRTRTRHKRCTAVRTCAAGEGGNVARDGASAGEREQRGGRAARGDPAGGAERRRARCRQPAAAHAPCRARRRSSAVGAHGRAPAGARSTTSSACSSCCSTTSRRSTSSCGQPMPRGWPRAWRRSCAGKGDRGDRRRELPAVRVLADPRAPEPQLLSCSRRRVRANGTGRSRWWSNRCTMRPAIGSSSRVRSDGRGSGRGDRAQRTGRGGGGPVDRAAGRRAACPAECRRARARWCCRRRAEYDDGRYEPACWSSTTTR